MAFAAEIVRSNESLMEQPSLAHADTYGAGPGSRVSRVIDGTLRGHRLTGIAGVANTVYHPADYSLLSHHVPPKSIGHAYSIHTFAGFLGGAVAPAIMAGLVAWIGGLGALIVAGAIGPVVALLLVVVGIPDASSADRKADGVAAPKQTRRARSTP